MAISQLRLTVLDQKDLYRRAKERAMIVGYHARWDKPPPTEFVEAFFDIPLVNPETGVASRTYRRGGKIDAIADLDEPIKRPECAASNAGGIALGGAVRYGDGGSGGGVMIRRSVE